MTLRDTSSRTIETTQWRYQPSGLSQFALVGLGLSSRPCHVGAETHHTSAGGIPMLTTVVHLCDLAHETGYRRPTGIVRQIARQERWDGTLWSPFLAYRVHRCSRRLTRSNRTLSPKELLYLVKAAIETEVGRVSSVWSISTL